MTPLIRILLSTLLACLLGHAAGAASAITNPTPQRSYVSLKGDDANNCGAAAPCRTWQAALAQTQPGGEILTLDSGGFGLLNITQAVTLVVPPGVYGGASPPAGAGITINAPGQTVVLKGVTIEAQASGTLGIDIPAAASVIIQDATVGNASTGIRMFSAGTLQVIRTTVTNCVSGITLAPLSGSLIASVESSNISGNRGDAFDISDNVIVDIASSSLSMNGGLAINAVNSTVNSGMSLGMGVAISDSRLIGNSEAFLIADTSGVTAANSYVGSALRNNVIINGGAACVSVLGAASSWLSYNLITGCTSGIYADATAQPQSTQDNIIGSHNKTLVGGTANVALPAPSLW